MTIKNTLSATKAREDFFSILTKVQTPGQYVTLTDKGTPKAVIMSAEEHESLLETIEVMRDFPDLNKDTAELKRDMKSGAYKNYITLDEILAKEGYVLNDKGKKKYAVPVSPKSKRGKKS